MVVHAVRYIAAEALPLDAETSVDVASGAHPAFRRGTVLGNGSTTREVVRLRSRIHVCSRPHSVRVGIILRRVRRQLRRRQKAPTTDRVTPARWANGSTAATMQPRNSGLMSRAGGSGDDSRQHHRATACLTSADEAVPDNEAERKARARAEPRLAAAERKSPAARLQRSSLPRSCSSRRESTTGRTSGKGRGGTTGSCLPSTRGREYAPAP